MDRYLTTIAVSAILISGCSATGFLKSIETKAFDASAVSASRYCEELNSEVSHIQRQEARRHVRAEGSYGPEAPSDVAVKLDDDMANGQGPVVRIWCEGEEVPDEVWDGLATD